MNEKIEKIDARSSYAEVGYVKVQINDWNTVMSDFKKLRSENEEYKKNLMRERFLIRERDLWIQRWADLEKWIKNEIEIYCKCAKWDSDEDLLKDALESVTKKMHELESGGESSPSDGSKAQDRCRADGKLASGEPKPDSLSLCKSCGCMTNTTHDEETVERCGKCGKVKAVRG